MLAARDGIKDNEKVSKCGRRFWELTGGVLRCAACGGAMATNYITPRKTGYYRCGRRYRLGALAGQELSSRRDRGSGVELCVKGSQGPGAAATWHGRDARQGKGIEFTGAWRG